MQNTVQSIVSIVQSLRGVEVSQGSVGNQKSKKENLRELILQFDTKFNTDTNTQIFLRDIVDIVVTAETIGQNTFTSAAYKQSMIIMKAILKGQEDGTTAQSAPTAESSLPSQLLANLLELHMRKNFGCLSNSEELKGMARDLFMTVLALPDLIKNESQTNQEQCAQVQCNNIHCNKDSALRETLMQKLKEETNPEVFSQIEPFYNKGLPQILSDNVPQPPRPHPVSRPIKSNTEQQTKNQCCVVL